MKSYDRPKANLSKVPRTMFAAFACLSFGITPQSNFLLQSQALGFDPRTQTQEYTHPGILQSPLALSAKANKDPDLPSPRDSLSGPHSEQFWKAMDAEIASLESKGTWEVVERSSMPPGTKAVPGTWAQHVKRLPTGELSKYKVAGAARATSRPTQESPTVHSLDGPPSGHLCFSPLPMDGNLAQWTSPLHSVRAPSPLTIPCTWRCLNVTALKDLLERILFLNSTKVCVDKSTAPSYSTSTCVKAWLNWTLKLLNPTRVSSFTNTRRSWCSTIVMTRYGSVPTPL